MTQSIRSQNERGRFAIAILVKNDVGTERFLSKIMRGAPGFRPRQFRIRTSVGLCDAKLYSPVVTKELEQDLRRLRFAQRQFRTIDVVCADVP